MEITPKQLKALVKQIMAEGVEEVEETPKPEIEVCPYCDGEYKRLAQHLNFCPDNPDNAKKDSKKGKKDKKRKKREEGRYFFSFTVNFYKTKMDGTQGKYSHSEDFDATTLNDALDMAYAHLEDTRSKAAPWEIWANDALDPENAILVWPSEDQMIY